MFTIVTVYNKKDFLERVLLDALKKQTAAFELIAIDNTAGKYGSAAQAFNAEVKDPKGDYILFVHQDVDFGDNTEWLHEVERSMETLKDPGVVGFAGFDTKGHFHGYISSCGQKLGKEERAAVEVQTVDGFLFIIPKKVFEAFTFDETTFDGWHLYSDDYSLTVRKHKFKTYVVPHFVYHRSFAANTIGIAKYKRRFFLKHGGITFTSVGVISKKNFIKSFVEQLVEPVYNFLFPGWISLLQKETAGLSSVLDLACGYNSPIQYVKVPKKVGVEANEDYLEETKKKAIHAEYIKGDIRTVTFLPRSFDAVFVSETLENLNEGNRVTLLDRMEIWAKKKVIIVTAHGHEQLSDELKRKGYRVHGIEGFKLLRNKSGYIKYRPWYLFVLLSALSQKLAYFMPSVASRIFAVKDI